MNKGLFVSGLMLASFSLFTACGGGGSSSSSNSSNNSSTTLTYTGNKESAAISASNQKALVSALLISALDVNMLADEAGVASRNSSTSATPLHLKNFYQQLLTVTDAQLNDAQARSIDLEQKCTAGGTLKATGSLDDATNLGTLQLTFTQCNTGDALVNGMGSITINKVDMNLRQVTDFTFAANTLSETIGSTTYTIGGSFRYSKDTSTGVEQGVSNIARKTSAGAQSLDVDLTFATENTKETITGKLCEGTNGCVTVVTSEPYAVTNGVVTQGKVVMAGANGSKLKLYTVSNVLWMDLDANGDGAYEASTRYTP